MPPITQDFGAHVPDEDALDMLEMCAGSHHLSSAAVEHGMMATCLDVPCLAFIPKVLCVLALVQFLHLQ